LFVIIVYESTFARGDFSHAMKYTSQYKPLVNKPSPFGLFLFVCVLSLLFLSHGVSASTIDNATLSWSFENFPASTVTDDSGNGYTGSMTDPFNMITTSSKVENWAVRVTPSSNYINLSNSFATPSTSYSFWVYPINNFTTTNYLLFSDGHQASTGGGLNVGIKDNENIVVYILGGAGCGSTNTRLTQTTGNNINVNEWNHVVIRANSLTSVDIFINGVQQSTTTSGTGSTFSNLGFLSIGRIPGLCTTWLASSSSESIIDQFIIYDFIIDSSQIANLYNAGNGFNPYNNLAPTQTASILNIEMGFNSFTSRDFGNFFLGEDKINLVFNYSNASYNVSSTGTFSTTSANTGAFAIQATNPTSFSFWSFGSTVPPTTITVQACNSNGCTETDFVYSVGIDAPVPQQIASPANIQLSPGASTTRTYSNFFVNYNARFLTYTSPDGGNIIVSTGFPNDNSCFTASITGDVLSIQAKNVGTTCGVNNARLVVDDGIVSAQSEPISITVTTQETTGVETVDTILGLFPPSETLSFSARMLYSVGLLIIILGFTAGLMFYSPDTSRLAGIIGAFTSLVAVVFLTSIGYIPVWIPLLFGLLAVLIGVGFARSIIIGGGSGGE